MARSVSRDDPNINGRNTYGIFSRHRSQVRVLAGARHFSPHSLHSRRWVEARRLR